MFERTDPLVVQSMVIGSILLGLLIAVYPISPELSSIRPEIICLLVIYWVTNLPQHVGIVYAWCIGFFQDIVEGTVWGAHAMALAIVAYICVMAYQRIKNYSVWHQTIWIFVLVGFHQVNVNWIQSMAGYHSSTLCLILSTAVSALCWPLVYFVIRRLQLLYRIQN